MGARVGHKHGQRGRARGVGACCSAALAVSVLGAVALSPSDAEAAVQGKQGIEIEGARDRRGFFIGGGLGAGGTIFWIDDFIPALRTELVIGGGVTKRFTLGANLHVTPYLAKNTGVAFGGDIEATGYLWRGFFVRGGLGLGGVPKRDHENPDREGLTIGMGGAASLGYEFFLNATAAMGVALTYDARFVPGSRLPRQTALVGVRFLWF